MDYFISNSKALRQCHYYLYQMIEDEVILSQTTEGISSIETRDGNMALVVEQNGMPIRFNSAYRPLEEAKKWSEKYNFINIQCVVQMFGFGNGIFARQLLHNLQEDATLLIFEPNPAIFSYAMMHYDLTDIISDSRVYIVINTWNEMMFDDTLLRKVYWANLASQYMVIHPQYDKLYEQEFIWFLQSLKTASDRAVINKNTDSFLGKRVVENMLANIPHLIGSNLVSDIRDCIPNEVPAIIVSAGPSLRKNIEQLKRAKGRAVIFAVDTALKFLESQDVTPDFVVTIDPRKSIRHFECNLGKTVPAISKIEARPELLAINQAKKLFYSSHEFLERFYQSNGIEVEDYTSGGSVATAAFSVCVSMNFNTIVLVGQDLAFDKDVTHVDGRVQKKNVDVGIREVEGIDGTMVKTRYDWSIYLDWFESAIYTCPNVEVIDATEGGAKIHGTKIMTLEQVVEEYCTVPFDVETVITKANPTLDVVKEAKLREYMINAQKELTEIKTKAGEATACINKFLEKYRVIAGMTEELQNYAVRISEINQVIERKSAYLLLDSYLAEFARTKMDQIYQMKESEYENTISTYQNSKDFYLEIIKMTEEIKPLLAKAVQAL